MLMLLIACVGTTPSDTQPAPDDTATSPHPCVGWAGLEPGETRYFDTQQTTQEEKEYRYWYTQTVQGIEGDVHSATVTVAQQAWQTGGGYSEYSATLELVYRCDAEGVWYLSSRRDYSGTFSGGGENEGWSEAHFEGYLLLPADPTAGPWTADWSATFTDHTDTEVTDARSYTFTPQAPEEVFTPGGSFTALPVVGTQDGNPIGSWWYAEGEGLVQTLDIERVPAFE